MAPSHVVVDGSNLATEGRTLPSLSQLEEAIAAYEAEQPDAELIVVVDATFEHRIDEKDRERFKAKELNGELTAPPAGAVGRGDAFILLIAKKMDAVVLSNDSFQEFHGEHPWLFEEGRLIGGKPVPGVGWIFTPRNPVRGPKSRAATKASAKRAGPVKKLSVTRPDGSKPKLGDTLTPAAPVLEAPRNVRVYELAKELGLENKQVLALAAQQGVKATSHSSSIDAAGAASIRAAHADRKVKASELLEELGIELKALKELGAAAGIKVASPATPLTAADAERLRQQASKGAARAASTARALAEVSQGEEGAGEPSTRRRRRRRRSGGGEQSAAPASAPLEKAAASLVNEPLDLVTFLATHNVGSLVDGVVSSFTSHGAMVEVPLGPDRSFHCYVRTVNLGNPPPTRARDAIRKAERYRFEVLSIDAASRVAELRLVLDQLAEAPTGSEEQGSPAPTRARRPRSTGTAARGAKQADVAKQSPAPKTASAARARKRATPAKASADTGVAATSRTAKAVKPTAGTKAAKAAKAARATTTKASQVTTKARRAPVKKASDGSG